MNYRQPADPFRVAEWRGRRRYRQRTGPAKYRRRVVVAIAVWPGTGTTARTDARRWQCSGDSHAESTVCPRVMRSFAVVLRYERRLTTDTRTEATSLCVFPPLVVRRTALRRPVPARAQLFPFWLIRRERGGLRRGGEEGRGREGGRSRPQRKNFRLSPPPPPADYRFPALDPSPLPHPPPLPRRSCRPPAPDPPLARARDVSITVTVPAAAFIILYGEKHTNKSH